MGKVIINEATPKNVITLAGEMVGPCYGSDTSDSEKNYKRGLNCIRSGHFRVMEYMEAWFVLEGYSARVIRELYTHIGGAPTRTQASTRYINYENFQYIIPPTIRQDEIALDTYMTCMSEIKYHIKDLEKLGIPIEDISNLLPLGMTTTVSIRMNARTLMNMSEQRLCNRAYWEYRKLMRDIIAALGEYSEEWKTIAKEFFKCKCDKCGWCEEEFSCGCYPKKEDVVVIKKESISEESTHKYNNIIDCKLNKVNDYFPIRINDYPLGFKVTC